MTRARPSRRQPAGAREHRSRPWRGRSSWVPTASSSTSTAPPTARLVVRHDADTPAGVLGDLTRAEVARGPARGADARRGARRLPGHAGERRGEELPGPDRAVDVLRAASLGARARASTTCWCRRSTCRPSTSCTSAAPGLATGFLVVRARSVRRRWRRRSSTVTPPSTPTSGALGGSRTAWSRRPTTGGCGSTCGRSTSPISCCACATPASTRVITDVPDLALERAQGRDDGEAVGLGRRRSRRSTSPR